MGLARNYDSTAGTSGGAVTFTPDFDAPAKVWMLQNLSAVDTDVVTFSLVGKDYKVRGGRALKLSLVADSVTISGSGAAYLVRCADVPSALDATLKASAGSGSADTGEVVVAATTSGSKHSLTKTKTISRPTVDAAAFFELPAAATAGFEDYIVKDGKGIGGAHTITISAAGGTIDGAASASITSNYGALVFVSDGTNWNIL